MTRGLADWFKPLDDLLTAIGIFIGQASTGTTPSNIAIVLIISAIVLFLGYLTLRALKKSMTGK